MVPGVAKARFRLQNPQHSVGLADWLGFANARGGSAPPDHYGKTWGERQDMSTRHLLTGREARDS